MATNSGGDRCPTCGHTVTRCLNCKSVIIPRPSVNPTRTKKFCGDECKIAHWRKNNRPR